jgi:hypothetical protein
MFQRQIRIVVSLLAILAFLRAAPAWAHGDKVIPQVVDGAQSDGLRYITKFDLTNISYSSSAAQPLTKVTLLFFTADGRPWTVSTKDQGATSAVPVTIGATQTVRVETTGTGAISSGYAILRNLEATTYLPDDREVVITVYYEVLQGDNVINTVSVPVGQPTVSCTFPVEIDMTQTPNLLTGFAIINLIDAANTAEIDLYSSDSTLFGQRLTLTLSSGNTHKMTVGFLNEPQFFNLPANTKFKGSAFVTSAAPIAVLPLLLTPTSTGPQYATLAPTYLDGLRTNTLMYLEQGYALDADLSVVDYFHSESSSIDAYDEGPWDVLFHTVSQTARQLLPQNGAMVSTLGVYGSSMIDQFDAITLGDLRSKNYTINPIDLTDNSPNLVDGFAFAIKTNLGHYAKARVRYTISYTGGGVDLVLEVYVYK